MFLNTLQPALGSKKPGKRLGRGIGSGRGKTCGKGHKGQKARAGGYHKVGFEGGQMPLQRRIPKFGFRSRKALFHQEIRLDQLNNIQADVIDFDALKTAGLIRFNTKTVKIILAGEITKTVNLRQVPITKGAKAAIEAKGGSVEV
jgi:large subunit ribosomal protein L15